MTISIIVPTLNEADAVTAAIESARRAVGDCEIIVVDAGSVDGTAAAASRAGARVVQADGSRSEAMNIGAAHAVGQVLLFLHADTILPTGAGAAIHDALATASAGAFRISFDRRRPLLELLANFRSRRLGIIYGDQAIFTTRAVFDRVGGYRQMPIMEDCEFISSVRSVGRVVVVPLAVITSTRRHRHHGTAQTLLRGWLIQALYRLGVSPARLARMYPPIR
jgi:rSAM/selenodomain-associated transferase 2